MADTDTRPYPFEGCCEHTFNAHSRKHCLLCECEKRPPPPPPPDIVDVTACAVCHALTPDRAAHGDWHARTLEREANVLAAVAHLASAFGLPVPQIALDIAQPTTPEETPRD